MSPIQKLQKITIRIPAITSAPPSVRPTPSLFRPSNVLLVVLSSVTRPGS